ncbi:uncharacterized protein LOC135140890 [Zophobas morio]|uniref:uncharacterized protein LOC135140890 n=1 Tax=Zophobas morio TaxID=2755281 RepID=UPI003083D3EE
MAPYEIKKLNDLLDSEVVSASITNLTSAGDNYASAIFSVDATLEDDQSIRAVAKMIPQNDFIRRLFRSEKTFRNEVGYYRTIAPCLRKFQEERGLSGLLSSYPDFYNARFSLQPSSDQVDNDAVLLIKNIKTDGFTIMDRKVGFDFDQSKLILDKMAELHATVSALKTVKPDVFDKELGEFFDEFDMYESKPESVEQLINSLVDILVDDEFCVQNMAKIRETLHSNSRFAASKNRKEFQNTPYVSLVHTDMWTNNIMVKVVDGKTVDVKFVDYQIYEYSSLTRDVVFFLFSSVQLPVLEKQLDDLLLHYFESFVKWLEKLNSDTSVFTFEGFLREMGSVVKQVEFIHILLMMKPMFALDKDTKEVDNLQRDDFLNGMKELAEGCKPKVSFVVRELMRRGWI